MRAHKRQGWTNNENDGPVDGDAPQKNEMNCYFKTHIIYTEGRCQGRNSDPENVDGSAFSYWAQVCIHTVSLRLEGACCFSYFSLLLTNTLLAQLLQIGAPDWTIKFMTIFIVEIVPSCNQQLGTHTRFILSRSHQKTSEDYECTNSCTKFTFNCY